MPQVGEVTGTDYPAIGRLTGEKLVGSLPVVGRSPAFRASGSGVTQEGRKQAASLAPSAR